MTSVQRAPVSVRVELAPKLWQTFGSSWVRFRPPETVPASFLLRQIPMTGFILAVIVALLLTIGVLFAGVAALPALLILLVLVGGVYLFTHTRRA